MDLSAPLPRHRRGHLLASVLVAAFVLSSIAPPGAAGATEVVHDISDDVGELVYPTSSDQLKKPYRLTWCAYGRWRMVGSKSSGAGSGWRVWRRNLDGSWDFGSEVLSTVGADRFDVFHNPDDGKVYAVQRSGSQPRLLRFTHDPGTDMFTLSATAALPISTGEPTLTVDTLGRVWIAATALGRMLGDLGL
jgi:hypothetical protein